MIEYIVGETKYAISYRELREAYSRLTNMDNAAFLKALPEAIHTACVISWFKELPADATIGDRGVVHELAHILHLGETDESEILRIRALFSKLLELA